MLNFILNSNTVIPSLHTVDVSSTLVSSYASIWFSTGCLYSKYWVENLIPNQSVAGIPSIFPPVAAYTPNVPIIVDNIDIIAVMYFLN